MKNLHNKITCIIIKYRNDHTCWDDDLASLILKELKLSMDDYKETDVNFNHAHEQAIKALRYIGEHGKTASGGEQFPNDECCYQIADELERSFKPIKRLFE